MSDMIKKPCYNFFIFTKLILLGLFLTSCSSLMYYPQPQQFFDPAKFNLKPEEIFFKNKEGQTLHGWWFQANTSKPKGTWIFFHGNAENLTSHFLSLSWLPAEGYNYFIFDYPGYGKSEGKPSPYHNVISGNAAIEWVHQNKDPNPLIVYGQSMGGIVAMRSVIEVKNHFPIQVVIADGSFSSFQRIARKKLSQHALTWLIQPFVYVLLSDRWAPDVNKISPIPLIVMHGENDFVVEFEHGKKVFKEAKEPKILLSFPKGSHGDLFWVEGKAYRKTVLDQINQMKK